MRPCCALAQHTAYSLISFQQTFPYYSHIMFIIGVNSFLRDNDKSCAVFWRIYLFIYWLISRELWPFPLVCQAFANVIYRGANKTVAITIYIRCLRTCETITQLEVLFVKLYFVLQVTPFVSGGICYTFITLYGEAKTFLTISALLPY